MFLAHRLSALIVATSGLAILGARTSPHRGDEGPSLAAANDAGPEAQCQVRGVWKLISMSQDGKDQPLAGYEQMKVVTARHFMWLGQAAKRDTLPLKTELDTLRAYQVAGGAGTYTTSGNSYVEHLNMFIVPSWVGTSFRATCRIEGSRWYHSFTMPIDTTAGSGPYQHIVEVWQRVE